MMSQGLSLKRRAATTLGMIFGAAMPLLLVFDAAAEDLFVIQKGRIYLPDSLNAHVGDRVVFSNEDDVTHNVYSESPAATFDLGAQSPGQKMEIILNHPGTVDIECEIHPKMHMVINVK